MYTIRVAKGYKGLVPHQMNVDKEIAVSKIGKFVFFKIRLKNVHLHNFFVFLAKSGKG